LNIEPANHLISGEIELFNLLADWTKYKIRDFYSQNISNLAWSFAVMNIHNIELFDLIANETKNKINNFNSQEISNLAWSFAVLNIKNVELLEILIDKLNEDDVFIFGETQLYYVYLHIKYEIKSDKLIDLMEKKKFNKIPEIDNNISSLLHLEISKYLKILNIKHENEIFINGISCDIYLDDDYVIEINGPTHYAYCSKYEMGRTIFKTSLLKTMGKNVITIPYWEWYELKDEQEKTSYLNMKLTNNYEIIDDCNICTL
jgi:hypothetical protein